MDETAYANAWLYALQLLIENRFTSNLNIACILVSFFQLQYVND